MRCRWNNYVLLQSDSCYWLEIGVAPKEVHIRNMTRKWASCSSKGRLTVDPALLKETEEVLSKAIIHELLYLKYPNHGRMFNALLKTYLERKAHKSPVFVGMKLLLFISTCRTLSLGDR